MSCPGSLCFKSYSYDLVVTELVFFSLQERLKSKLSILRNWFQTGFVGSRHQVEISCTGKFSILNLWKKKKTLFYIMIVLLLCHLSHCVLLEYMQHQESFRFGISSGKALLVGPLSIFSAVAQTYMVWDSLQGHVQMKEVCGHPA